MRGKNSSIRRGAARFAGLSLGLSLGVTTLLSAVGAPAQAADGPAGVPDTQGARQVLQSAQLHDTVSRFLNATTSVGADGGQGSPMDAGTREPRQQAFSLRAPVALYEITPDFVTGKAKADPADTVRLAYLASQVDAAGGHRATVLLAETGKGSAWHLAGIRDGDSDVAYAGKATPDSTVFTEPQIHAWYRLKNGAVEPLNAEAVSAFGGQRTMSLAAYQTLVHHRYAGKLPGSRYDRKGLAGGYGLAAPAAAPAHPGSASASMVLGGSAAALALAGAAVATRVRRRRAQAG